MTTTISFPTRDCIVVGCDSLATTSRPLISPADIMDSFFESGKLKLDEKGEPILKTPSDLVSLLEYVPYNQMPDVTKLFELKPAPIAVLHAGALLLGNKSIKNIIEEFLSKQETKKFLKGDYTIYGVSKKLFAYIKKHYNEVYKNQKSPPYVELIVSGYSKRSWQPEVMKLEFKKKQELQRANKKGDFNPVFGGQHDVIERIVFGVDEDSYQKISIRVLDLLLKYYELLSDFIKKKKINILLPKPDSFNELAFTQPGSWPFSGISLADLKNFSEQAAINFVEFLINIMIQAQQFNNRMPTVGGEIQLALINKREGFKWISKEEYKYKNYGVPKHDKKP